MITVEFIGEHFFIIVIILCDVICPLKLVTRQHLKRIFIQSCVKQIDSTIIRVVLKIKVFDMTKVECKQVLYASLFIRT